MPALHFLDRGPPRVVPKVPPIASHVGDGALKAVGSVRCGGRCGRRGGAWPDMLDLRPAVGVEQDVVEI